MTDFVLLMNPDTKEEYHYKGEVGGPGTLKPVRAKTRLEAELMGARFYYPEQPCKYGHENPRRWTSDGVCEECALTRKKKPRCGAVTRTAHRGGARCVLYEGHKGPHEYQEE